MRCNENPGTPTSDAFREVKMVPKWGKSTNGGHNVFGSEGGQNTSTCTIWGHSSIVFARKAENHLFWFVSLCQNATKMRKMNRRWPKSNPFSRWSGCISNFRPFKVTPTKLKWRINVIFVAITNPRWKGTISTICQKIQNCNFGLTRNLPWVNHLEVSPLTIRKLDCNKNSDEESTLNIHMDTRQSERYTFKEIANDLYFTILHQS